MITASKRRLCSLVEKEEVEKEEVVVERGFWREALAESL